MYSLFKKFLQNLAAPVSLKEDNARQEFILNILLVSMILLSLISFIVNLVDWSKGLSPSASAGMIFVLFLFFSILYFLSKKGYARVASFIFLTIFFMVVTLMDYAYGVDLPMEILSYSLIIVMAGVLISTRVAFVVTFVTCLMITTLGYLQGTNIIHADRYWINMTWKIEDFIIASVLFFIIATVSWLSNREIEKSLIRARRSEAELIVERDSLEIKVEERTRDIKEMQLEKMGQLYRFAEFGRLSSGLFHDLVNPLTAVSLNMEIVRSNEVGGIHTDDSKAYLDRALSATRKMEDFVTAVRKQISKQEHKIQFSLNEEIRQVLDILLYKANRAGVKLVFTTKEQMETYGDNIKFSQVVLNLVGNAIDAYVPNKEGDRAVHVSLSNKSGVIEFTVHDQGVGIPSENLAKIFEPFFTTKNAGSGMGIGLSLVKKIIEKDFNGTIAVSSNEGSGSIFTITFPHVAQS